MRRRFGSFKAAVQCAGIDTVQVHLTRRQHRHIVAAARGELAAK